jgi:hypothetical protein
LANLINLAIFAIIEQDLIVAAINTFDVHAKGHNDLKIRVVTLIISHSNFNSFV